MSGALPPGWASAPLGSLGDWFGGGTPSKAVSEYWQNGTVPWVSPKDMKRPLIDSAQDQITEKAVRESATSLVPARSVLMVTRSGILEHSFPVAVNTVPVTMNQDLKAVAVRGVDPIYTSYFLQSREQDILRTCKKDGTTVASIDSDRLAAYEVAIAPAHEQTRIISRIDELFSRIDEGERALKQVRTLVKRCRQSVLKAAVTGELTREWREKHEGTLETGGALLARLPEVRRETGARDAEPLSSQILDFPMLPGGWRWASVEQAGDVKLGRQRAPQHHSGDHMRPYLRVANVYEDRLDLSDVMQMNFTPDEFKTYALRPGDILLNEGQSPELVGRPAMYRGEIPGCCYQKTLLRFRANEGVLPDFALCVFRFYLHSGRFRRSANITTSIAHLAAERFVKIEFPIPPIQEQQEIVELVTRNLGRLKHLEGELGTHRVSAVKLRQVVLRSAFSGALVAQHSSDEPAAALLGRIADGRDSNAVPNRHRRNKATA